MTVSSKQGLVYYSETLQSADPGEKFTQPPIGSRNILHVSWSMNQKLESCVQATFNTFSILLRKPIKSLVEPIAKIYPSPKEKERGKKVKSCSNMGLLLPPLSVDSVQHDQVRNYS